MKPAMDDDDRDELLERMGRLARETFSDATNPVASAAGKRQLKVALATARPRRRTARWAALAAVICGALAVFAYREMPHRLAYEVEGASPSDGAYLQGTRRSAAIAHFTDGTEVRVGEGGRARIVDVETHGARVALEQGRAHLHVVHRAEARWSVDAGPFTIAVTGTEFDAEWSASDGVLVVEMSSGAVVVHGPLATDGIGVHAGQRLVASVPEGRLHIEPLAPRAATNGDAVREPAGRKAAVEEPRRDAVTTDSTYAAGAMDEPAARGGGAKGTRHELATTEVANDARVTPEDVGDRTTSKPAPSEHRQKAGAESKEPAASTGQDTAAPMTWAKRVGSGDFRGVIADAEGRGLDATLAEAPLGDLVALADAARYTGSSSIAREALLSQRKRYPGSADARAAAFLLGRIAEDKGTTGEAIDWYERYLSEAPRGAFAAEALGREMLAAARARGAASAAELAKRYLARFPSGPYADRARKLAAEP